MRSFERSRHEMSRLAVISRMRRSGSLVAESINDVKKVSEAAMMQRSGLGLAEARLSAGSQDAPEDSEAVRINSQLGKRSRSEALDQDVKASLIASLTRTYPVYIDLASCR